MKESIMNTSQVWKSLEKYQNKHIYMKAKAYMAAQNHKQLFYEMLFKLVLNYLQPSEIFRLLQVSRQFLDSKFKSIIESRMEFLITNHFSTIPNQYDEVIANDVERTFQDQDFFKQTHNKLNLNTVLKALSSSMPQLGYIQGINYLSAILLSIMPPEEAYWASKQILGKYSFGQLFIDQFKNIQLFIFQTSCFFKNFIPDLFNHMKIFNVQYDITIQRQFLTFFANDIDIQLMIKILNLFIFKGFKPLIRASLALFSLHKKRILQLRSQEDIYEYLQDKFSEYPVSHVIFLREMKKFKITRSLLEQCAYKYKKCKNNQIQLFDLIKTQYNSLQWFNINGTNSPVSVGKSKTRKNRSIQSTHVSNYKERVSAKDSMRDINSISSRDKNSNNSSLLILNGDRNSSIDQQTQCSKREHSMTYTDSTSYSKYNQILTLKRYSSRDLNDNSSYQSLQKYIIQNNPSLKGQDNNSPQKNERSKSRNGTFGIDLNEDVRNMELKIQALLQPSASESEDEKSNKPSESQLNHQSFKDYRCGVNSRQILVGQQLQNQSNLKQNNKEMQMQNHSISQCQINYSSKQRDNSENSLNADGNQEITEINNIQLNFKKKIQHNEQISKDSQSQKNIQEKNSPLQKINSNSSNIIATNRKGADQIISQGNLSQRDKFQSEMKSLTPKVVSKEKLGLNYLEYLKQPQQLQHNQIQIQQLQQRQQSSYNQQQTQYQILQKQQQQRIQIQQIQKKNDNSKNYNVDKFFKDNQIIQEEKRRRSDKDNFFMNCSIKSQNNINVNHLNNSANNIKNTSQTNTISTANISIDSNIKVREREPSTNLLLNKSTSNSNNNQNIQNNSINNTSQMTYSNYLQLNSNQTDTVKDIYKQSYNKNNQQQLPQNTLTASQSNGNTDFNVQKQRKPESYTPMEKLYPSHSLHTPEETPVSRKHAISLFGIGQSSFEQISTNISQGQTIQQQNIQAGKSISSQNISQSHFSQNKLPVLDKQSQNQYFQPLPKAPVENNSVNVYQQQSNQVPNTVSSSNNTTNQQNLSNKQLNMQQQHYMPNISNVMNNQQSTNYIQQINNYNQNNKNTQYNVYKQPSNENDKSANIHNQLSSHKQQQINHQNVNQSLLNINDQQRNNYNKQLDNIYNQQQNVHNSSISEQNIQNINYNYSINSHNQIQNINPSQNALTFLQQNMLPLQSITSQQLSYTSTQQKDKASTNQASLDYNTVLISKSNHQNQISQKLEGNINTCLSQKQYQTSQQQNGFYQNQMRALSNKQNNLSNNTSMISNFNNGVSINENIPYQNYLTISTSNVNQYEQIQNKNLSQLHNYSTTNQHDSHQTLNQQNILQNSKIDLCNIGGQQTINQPSQVDTPSNNQASSMNNFQQNNVSSYFHNQSSQIQKPQSSHSQSNITKTNQQFNMQNKIDPQNENQQLIIQLDQQKQKQQIIPYQQHFNQQSQFAFQSNQKYNNINDQQQSNSLQSLNSFKQSELYSPSSIKQEQNNFNLLQQKSAQQIGSQLYSNFSNNKLIGTSNNNNQQNPQGNDSKQMKQKDILNIIQLQLNQNQQQYLNIQQNQSQNTINDSSQTRKTQKTTINSNRQIGIQLLKPSNNQASFFQNQKKQNQQLTININQQPKNQIQQGVLNVDSSTASSSIKSKQLSQSTSNYNSSNNSNNGSNTGSVATKNTFQQQIQINQQQFVSLVMNQQIQQQQQQQKQAQAQILDQNNQHKMQCSSSQKGMQNANEISDQPATNSHLQKLQQRKNQSKFQSYSLNQNDLTTQSQSKLQQQGNNYCN